MIRYVRFERWILRQGRYRLFLLVGGLFIVIELAIYTMVGLGFAAYHHRKFQLPPMPMPLVQVSATVLSGAFVAAIMMAMLKRAARNRLSANSAQQSNSVLGNHEPGHP